MDTIKHLNEQFYKEKVLLNTNKDEINGSNRRLFLMLMRLGFVCCVSLYLFSFISEPFAPNRNGYFLLAILSVPAILLVSRFEKISNNSIFYYVVYWVASLLAALSSAFITPDYTGVMILIYLFEIPILILDQPLKIFLFEILSITTYLVIVIPNKNPNLVMDEIVNTIIFMAMGMVTGIYAQKVRLENINLSRKLNIERVTDVLTGLSNRRKLFEYFGECETNPLENTAYAIAIIDIDSFKSYNDTYGHIQGDNCLNLIGKCFTEFGNRHSIKFYRYGGEEFIGIVLKKSDEDLVNIFKELNRAILDLKIVHETMKEGFVTVSIGVTPIDCADTIIKFEQVIDKADKALYVAKANGKNTTVEYEKAFEQN